MPGTTTLTEVMFLVHFQAPLNLSFKSMVDFGNTFDNFPIALQLPQLPPIGRLDVGEDQIQIGFDVAGITLPRLQLRPLRDPYILSIQMDRFSFSWGRTGLLGGLEEYPGYEPMKALWKKKLERLDSWYQAQFGVPPKFNRAELGYFNAVPRLKASGEARKLSETFKISTPGRPVNAYQATWTEFLERAVAAPRVMANVGVGKVTGLTMEPQSALYFNFSGVGMLEDIGMDHPALDGMFDSLHARIFEMYQAAIISQES